MRQRFLTAVVLGLLAAGCVLSLLSGASWLLRPLPGGLPLGNAVAALGLIALAALPWLASRAGTWRRRCATLTLIAALAWLPLSALLAGNLQLNFNNGRGPAWLGLTATVLLLIMVMAGWTLAAGLAGYGRRWRQGHSR